MNRESLQALRLDRRLMRRRGWINQKELAKELEALPDVAHKAAPSGDEPAELAAADPESTSGL